MVMTLIGSSGLELLPHARGLKMSAPKGPVNELEVELKKKGLIGTHDDAK